MKYIVENWFVIVGLIAVCAAGGYAVAWLARVISFEAFSMMVDEALERMKKMLESNKAMQTLVSGEAGEVNE